MPNASLAAGAVKAAKGGKKMVSASNQRVELGKKSLGQRIVKDFKRYKYVYFMLVPVVVWYLLF